MKGLRESLFGIALFVMGAAHAADMIVLHYLDQDPGTPPYATRVLVTPDFMRMDSGENKGDFLLLDRRQRKAFNVMYENNLVMIFTPGKIPAKRANWKPKLDVRPAAPGTQRFNLTVNGVVCSEGVAARRAAPDAARAMAELKALMAAIQYRVWQETPPELQNDCDLANQVWDSGSTLKLGLPLQEREFTGRTRQLTNESKQPLQPELFRLPDGMPTIAAPS